MTRYSVICTLFVGLLGWTVVGGGHLDVI